MSKIIHLEPNKSEITFRNPPPNGEVLRIFPGEALYNPETGHIHILKNNDYNDPILLQLMPIKVAPVHRNRAIAKIASIIVSAFGIEFFEEDCMDEIADFFFDKGIDFSFNALADVASAMTEREVGFGYYDMKNKDLIFGFPIIMPINH